MIRLARKEDMQSLLAIYAAAWQFMRQNGNDAQWGGNYPGEEDLLADIREQRLYVLEKNDAVCACFMLTDGPDVTYRVIYDGTWAADTPYGVIHRVASDGTQKGVLAQCVAYARQFYSHLRIDTHQKNLPMQRALAKEGFVHRGTIFIADGTPRMAFDWLA